MVLWVPLLGTVAGAGTGVEYCYWMRVGYGCCVDVLVMIAGARHGKNIGCGCWAGVLGTSVVQGLGFVRA